MIIIHILLTLLSLTANAFASNDEVDINEIDRVRVEICDKVNQFHNSVFSNNMSR